MFGVNGHDNLLVIIPFSTIHFCVQTDNTTPRDSMLEDYTVRVIPLCAALLVGGLLFFLFGATSWLLEYGRDHLSSLRYLPIFSTD